MLAKNPAISARCSYPTSISARKRQGRVPDRFPAPSRSRDIYLVGDIVDGWRLRRTWHWPQTHNDVVQKLLRKARKGARITYIAGNHDEFLRKFQGMHFGGIVVADRTSTRPPTASVPRHPWRPVRAVVHNAAGSPISATGPTTPRCWSTACNPVRRLLGLPYWSFSSWAKVTGQEGGELHRFISDSGFRGSPPIALSTA